MARWPVDAKLKRGRCVEGRERFQRSREQAAAAAAKAAEINAAKTGAALLCR